METVKTITNSSQVEKVKYNSESKVLTVTFKPSKSYEYADVPQEVFDGLLGAELAGNSVGKYLNQYVKPVFKCKPVGAVTIDATKPEAETTKPTTPPVDDNDNF